MSRVTLPADLPGLRQLWDEYLGPNGEPLINGLGFTLKTDRLLGSGMDVAARWIAGRVRVEVGPTAPDWERYDGVDARGWWLKGANNAWVFFGDDRPSFIPANTETTRWRFHLAIGTSSLTDPAEAWGDGVIYFVTFAKMDTIVEALAEEFGHPPVLDGDCRDETGAVDVTGPHWFDIGHYVRLYPHDGVLPDGTREFRCCTEYTATTRAVLRRLATKEISADEVRS
jgi:hypothetical protein